MSKPKDDLPPIGFSYARVVTGLPPPGTRSGEGSRSRAEGSCIPSPFPIAKTQEPKEEELKSWAEEGEVWERRQSYGERRGSEHVRDCQSTDNLQSTTRTKTRQSWRTSSYKQRGERIYKEGGRVEDNTKSGRSPSGEGRNTLPRARGRGQFRGRGNTQGYGSLPRGEPRARTYSGGEGRGRGGGRGRGRGDGWRGRGRGGYWGSREDNRSVGPSERKLNTNSFRKKKEKSQSRGGEEQGNRSHSLPRRQGVGGNLNQSDQQLTKSSGNLSKPSVSMTSQSMMSVWSPNRECPTFAEVLRRNVSCEVLLDEPENTQAFKVEQEEVVKEVPMEIDTSQEEQYKTVDETKKQNEEESSTAISRIPDGFGAVTVASLITESSNTFAESSFNKESYMTIEHHYQHGHLKEEYKPEQQFQSIPFADQQSMGLPVLDQQSQPILVPTQQSFQTVPVMSHQFHQFQTLRQHDEEHFQIAQQQFQFSHQLQQQQQQQQQQEQQQEQQQQSQQQQQQQQQQQYQQQQQHQQQHQIQQQQKHYESSPDIATIEPTHSQTVQITQSQPLTTTDETEEKVIDTIPPTPPKRLSKQQSKSPEALSSQGGAKHYFQQNVKSYANILSKGLNKMSSVLRPAHSSSELTIEKKIPESIPKFVEPEISQERDNDGSKDTVPIKTEFDVEIKPEIPGLIFKSDLERRPSRKKRSKATPINDQFEEIILVDNEICTSKEITTKKIEQEDVLLAPEVDEDKSQTQDLKSNIVKRRGSKKKRKEYVEIPPKKCQDEIEKALYEIEIMEKEKRKSVPIPIVRETSNEKKEKRKSMPISMETNFPVEMENEKSSAQPHSIKSKRPSKKKKSNTSIQSCVETSGKHEINTCTTKLISDDDSGNLADDETDIKKSDAVPIVISTNIKVTNKIDQSGADGIEIFKNEEMNNTQIRVGQQKDEVDKKKDNDQTFLIKSVQSSFSDEEECVFKIPEVLSTPSDFSELEKETSEPLPTDDLQIQRDDARLGPKLEPEIKAQKKILEAQTASKVYEALDHMSSAWMDEDAEMVNEDEEKDKNKNKEGVSKVSDELIDTSKNEFEIKKENVQSQVISNNKITTDPDISKGTIQLQTTPKAYESLDDMSTAWMDENVEMISENEDQETLRVKQHATSEDIIISKPENQTKIIQSQEVVKSYESFESIKSIVCEDHKTEVQPQIISKISEASEIIKTIQPEDQKKDVNQKAQSANTEISETKDKKEIQLQASSKAFESLDDMSAAWMDEDLGKISDNEDDNEDSSSLKDLKASKSADDQKIEVQLESPSESIKHTVSLCKEDIIQKEPEKGVVGLREMLLNPPEEMCSELIQPQTTSKDTKSSAVDLQKEDKQEEHLKSYKYDEMSGTWMDEDVEVISDDKDGGVVGLREVLLNPPKEILSEQIQQQATFIDTKSSVADLKKVNQKETLKDYEVPDDKSDSWMNKDLEIIPDDKNDNNIEVNVVQKIIENKQSEQSAGTYPKSQERCYSSDCLEQGCYSPTCRQEKNKVPLALKAPSYSSIVSKPPDQAEVLPELPLISEVISLKPAKSKTEIIVLQDIHDKTQDSTHDKDGFAPVQGRREKKLSMRSSLKVKEDEDQELMSKSDTTNILEPEIQSNVNPQTDSKVYETLDDMSAAWMDEDVENMAGNDESDDESIVCLEEKEENIDTPLSIVSSNNGRHSNAGRLSAMEEAFRFSCDDDQMEDLDDLSTLETQEMVVENVDEKTSWAFVTSKTIPKALPTLEDEGEIIPSNSPALVVEVIESDPLSAEKEMDEEGFEVVHTKQKAKKKSSTNERKTSNKEIINAMDQPIEKTLSQTEQNVIENIKKDSKIEPESKENIEKINESVKVDIKDDNENGNDPWLAVPDEYIRKDFKKQQSNESKDGYTIEVKVSHKETCIGRKLHKEDTEEWKMDVKCSQSNAIPDIINRPLQKEERKSPSPKRSLDEAIFGSVKERKKSDTQDPQYDTLEQEEEVYWRLRDKVKKKRCRKKSGALSKEGSTSTEILNVQETDPSTDASDVKESSELIDCKGIVFSSEVDQEALGDCLKEVIDEKVQVVSLPVVSEVEEKEEYSSKKGNLKERCYSSDCHGKGCYSPTCRQKSSQQVFYDKAKIKQFLKKEASFLSNDEFDSMYTEIGSNVSSFDARNDDLEEDDENIGDSGMLSTTSNSENSENMHQLLKPNKFDIQDSIAEIPMIKEVLDKEEKDIDKVNNPYPKSVSNVQANLNQENVPLSTIHHNLDNLIDNVVSQGISESINLRKISVSPAAVDSYEEVAEISYTDDYPIGRCTSWAEIASIPKDDNTVDIDNHERVVKNAKQIFIPEIVTIEEKESEQVQEIDKDGFVRKLSRKERHRRSNNLDETDENDTSSNEIKNIEVESKAVKTVERTISLAQNCQEVQANEDVGNLAHFGMNSGKKISSCIQPSVATFVDDVYLQDYVLEDHNESTRKISVSPINLEEQVAISTPLESVAGTQITESDLRKKSTSVSITDNYQEIISTAVEQVVGKDEEDKEEKVKAVQRIVSSDGEQKLANINTPDLRMGLLEMPDIVLSSSHSNSATSLTSIPGLETMSSTKMAEAVDLIRPTGHQEVKLARQTSMEMQQAVEVQRPLSRKASTETYPTEKSPQLTPEVAKKEYHGTKKDKKNDMSSPIQIEKRKKEHLEARPNKSNEMLPHLPLETKKKEQFEIKSDKNNVALPLEQLKKEDTGANKTDKKPSETMESVVPKLVSCQPPLETGLITITLHEAKNLPKMDILGKADPYAVINVDNATFRTEIAKNTCNPTWNYTFKINTSEKTAENIFIEVFDADTFSKDDLIGQVNVNLRDIISTTKIKNKWINLQKPCKSGKLLFSANFISEDLEKPKNEANELKAKFQKKIKEIVTIKKEEQVKDASPIDTKSQSKVNDIISEIPSYDVKHLEEIENTFNEKLEKEKESCEVERESMMAKFKQPLKKGTINETEKNTKEEKSNLETKSPVEIPIIRETMKTFEDTSPGVTITELSDIELDDNTEATNPSSEWTYIPITIENETKKTPDTSVSTDTASVGQSIPNTEKIEQNVSEEEKPKQPKLSSDHKPLPLGTIGITLHEARNLPKMDTFGKADPYAVINIEKNSFRTEIIKNTCNPIWNYTFNVNITSETGESILVEIFDADILTEDELIGQININLREIISETKVGNKWIPLQKPCKSGELRFSADFIPEIKINKKQENVKETSDEILKIVSQSTKENTFSMDNAVTVEKDEQCQEELAVLKDKPRRPIEEKQIPKDKDENSKEDDKDHSQEILVEGVGEKQPDKINNKQSILASGPVSLDTGVITITLHEARNLPKMDTFGKADPYAVINVEKNIFRTETVKNTCNPKWNYTFKINTTNKTGETIFVEIFDADILTKDELIGQVNINLKEIITETKISHKWVTLQKPCKSGELLFSADFVLEESKKDIQIKESEILKESSAKIIKTVSKNSTVIPDNDIHLERKVRNKPNLATEEKDKIAKVDKVKKKENTKEVLAKATDTMAPPTVEHEGAKLLSSDMPLDKGIIRITLHKAKNLPKMDTFGKADPYAIINVEKNSFRTETAKNTCNPEWNYTFEFNTTSKTGDNIFVEIFDADILTKDDLIGQVNINLREIISETKISNKWIVLQKPCKSGELLFSADFVPDNKQEEIKVREQEIVSEPNDEILKEGSKKTKCNINGNNTKITANNDKQLQEDLNKKSEKPLKEKIITGDEDKIGKLSEEEKMKDQLMKPVSTMSPQCTQYEEAKLVSSYPPLSKGTITITLHEARNLPKMDTFGKTDPYAVINVEKDTFKTETVKNTCNPKWNYTFKINTTNETRENIFVEIFDADILTKDELIGQVNINLREILFETKINNKWIVLQKPCKSGELLFSADFVPEDGLKEANDKEPESLKIIKGRDMDSDNEVLSELPSYDMKYLEEIENAYHEKLAKEQKNIKCKQDNVKEKAQPQNPEPLKNGMVSLILHEAKNLPKMDTFGKGDPYAVLNIGKECFKTEPVKNTNNPVWNYGFEFDIKSEKREDIFIEIFDADMLSKDELIGQAHINLREIVSQGKIVKKWTVLQKPCKSGQLLYSAEFIPMDDQNTKQNTLLVKETSNQKNICKKETNVIQQKALKEGIDQDEDIRDVASLKVNLSLDKFWIDKFLFDDAEIAYFTKQSMNVRDSLTKEIKKYDSDDDDGNGDDFNNESLKSKASPSQTDNKESVETSESNQIYNWSDESTYLSPNIPLFKPPPLKVPAPNESDSQIQYLSQCTTSLTKNICENILSRPSPVEEHTQNIGSDGQDRKLGSTEGVSKKQLQDDIADLEQSVLVSEENLQKLSEEDIDSQLALTKYTLKSLEDMEKDAITLEGRLQTLTPGPDTQAMSASLTGTRTSLVTLHTQAEAHAGRIARYKRERMKRVEEVKKYQSLLIDLEHWLVETQRTITTEIRLSSVKAVKDQIRASETLEQDLRVRERQLNDLLIECNHLIPYTDVQEMAGKMAAHLNVLKTTFDDAQQILQVRLKNLQVRCI